MTQKEQLLKQLEQEINKTPTGELRNLLTDINILMQAEPKVCTGCGRLNTETLDEQYLACCPDNNYIPLTEYLKYSRYERSRGVVIIGGEHEFIL